MNVGIVGVDDARQLLLPIAEQEASREIAAKSVRLLNCWLGVSTKETIGSTFCVECDYLQECKNLYVILDRAEKLHPAARAREVIARFGLESDYL